MRAVLTQAAVMCPRRVTPARAVYCVEASALALRTRMAVKANGLDGIVTVLHGRMEDVELPEPVWGPCTAPGDGQLAYRPPC